jgi:flagellar protein FliL
MEQATTSAAPAAAAKSKSKRTLLLVLAGLLLPGGAGAGWFFLARGKKTNSPAETAEKSKELEYTLHMDSFTMNLADTEESHFLRVTMELGLDQAPKGEPGKEGAPSSEFPAAQTRDAILTVLTACKADQLLTPEGKDELKQRLIAALQQKVPEIGTRNVYFTEFLVQR